MFFLKAFFYLLISLYFVSPRVIRSMDLYFLNEIKYCLDNQLKDKCKEIILELEALQTIEEEKGNFRCQTSILGLQSELIKAIDSNHRNFDFEGVSITFVIKNC